MQNNKDHPLKVAAICLTKIFEQIESQDISQKSASVIDSEVEKAKLDGAFASRVFDVTMGVLRWKKRLDNEIALHLSKSKLDLPQFETNLLRASAYELTIRRSDEPAGLINEIVEIAKQRSNAGFAGFTNAILRKLASSTPHPKPDTNAPIEDLSSYYSVKQPVVEKMVEQGGRGWAQEILEATNDRILHQMRVNPFLEYNEGYPEQLGATQKIYRDEVFWESQALTTDIRKANLSGQIIVQSLPSQVAAIVLDPRPGDSVLDAASGIGIKAHHLISLIAGWGEIVLTDLSRTKRDMCYANFERWNVPEPDYRILNLSDTNSVRKEFTDEKFDAILLDVPCSGSGLLHHLPEKRYSMDLRKLHDFQKIQRLMLLNCLDLLEPEGSLVYSTCSIWHDENEHVTEAVLQEKSDFESVERLHFQPCGQFIGFYIEKIRRLE